MESHIKHPQNSPLIETNHCCVQNICSENEEYSNIERDRFFFVRDSCSEKTNEGDGTERVYYRATNFISNLIFFVGSLLYLCISIMEWKFSYLHLDDYDYDYDYNDDEGHYKNSSITKLAFSSFSSFKPALKGSEQEFFVANHRRMNIFGAILFFINSIGEIITSTISVRSIDDSDWGLEMKCIYLFNVSAAITFGSAATIDLFSYDFKGDWPDITSASLNMCSACFSLTATKWYQNITTIAEKSCLILSGEVLFFLGSLVDLILSVLDAYGSSKQNLLLQWNIFSSVLWLIDSILYLINGFCETNWFANNYTKKYTSGRHTLIPQNSEDQIVESTFTPETSS